LIICSVSLVENWAREAYTWFSAGTMDIMLYTNETQKSFWVDGGLWKKSRLPLAHRLIIIADSVGASVY
jgi:hypothetical protein